MVVGPGVLVVCAVVAISGLIYGVLGFGFGLLSVALLPYFISVKIAVPMTALQASIYSAIMLYGLRQHMNIRKALPIVAGLVLGLPPGVYLLRILSEEAIRKMLGTMIILYCVWSLWKASVSTPLFRNEAWGCLAGFLSGVVGGAILAGGPIIVAYLTLRGLPKEEMKATFLVWAVAMIFLLVPFYAVSGLLTYQVFLWSVIAFPFAGLGIYCGVKLFANMRQQIFVRLVLIFLAITGIRLLFS